MFFLIYIKWEKEKEVESSHQNSVHGTMFAQTLFLPYPRLLKDCGAE